MPNRILRDGILSSERVNALSTEAELFYRRLMSVVDDYGRYSAHPTLLRSRCYPLTFDSILECKISAWLWECVQNGLIKSYEVDGKPYLVMESFNQRNRAKESKYPPPPMTDTCPSPDRHLPTCPIQPALHESEAETKTEAIDGFAERMYARHPRKKNKPLVEGLVFTILRKHGAEKLAEIDRVHAQWCASDGWQRDGGRYVPSLDRWLSDEAYTQSPARSETVRTMPVMKDTWGPGKEVRS